MKSLIVPAILAFCFSHGALAKSTNGILFTCDEVTVSADGSESVDLTVNGIIPANGTDRLAVHYKTHAGEFAALNEAEASFRTSAGDDLARRYGSSRLVVQNSVSIVNVDFVARTIMIRIPVAVKVNGVDQSREIYFSTVPGTLLYSRNDESGKTASNVKTLFTGTDPSDSTKQMPDTLVTCSLNDNFN